MASSIKFNRYNVTDGTTKARVHYSLDNHVSGKPCVMIFAKDYNSGLGRLIPNGYKNDTDGMTDYFEEGNVRLFEDHKHYQAARKTAEIAKAKDDAAWKKTLAKRAAKFAGA